MDIETESRQVTVSYLQANIEAEVRRTDRWCGVIYDNHLVTRWFTLKTQTQWWQHFQEKRQIKSELRKFGEVVKWSLIRLRLYRTAIALINADRRQEAINLLERADKRAPEFSRLGQRRISREEFWRIWIVIEELKAGLAERQAESMRANLEKNLP